MAAGRRDIGALAVPDDGRIVFMGQHILEGQDRLLPWTLEIGCGMFVERDQVDFGFHRPQQFGQALGIFCRVVDILD